MSGIHGIEGFAGSAVQLALLDKWNRGELDGKPTIVLVHVMNPFGMANWRRWNENSVDLNRNLLLDGNFKEKIAQCKKSKEFQQYMKVVQLQVQVHQNQ